MSQSRNDDFMRGAAILCNALATIDEADQYGRTQLWWATFHGDTDVVKVLIGLGANVDNKGMGVVSYHKEERKCIISTDIYGPQRGIAEIPPLSPSLVAAVLGHHEILRHLLDAGAVVDQSLDGCSLWAAAANGHKEVCELLFQVANWHEITVSASLGGAADNGHAGIAEMMIHAGADVNFKRSEGKSVLFAASHQGNKEVVELLINARADVKSKNNDEQSSLFAASCQGHREVVEVLINAGAGIEFKNNKGWSSLYAASYQGHREVVEVLTNAGAGIEFKNNKGWSSLYAASFQGHREVVEVLINAGADVESKTNNGWSSLFAASHQGHREVVEQLINAGADVESKNNDGESSLFAASSQGHGEVVEILINAGADVESKDSDGWSSLFAASAQGHREVVEVLINAGADVESKNNDGQSSLFAASHQGHGEVVEVLIDAGVDVESKNNDGQSSLLAASYQGHREVVEVLIDAGVDVESKNNDGQSSLFAASYQGHGEVVEVLINAGADVGSANYKNKTDLMVAAENGHCDTVTILIDNGAKIPPDLLYYGIKSGNKDLVNSLINIDSLVINNSFIGTAIELAIQRDLVSLLQKLVRRSHYSADAGDCSLRVYRMLMILADDGTKTPQPPPIVEFLDGQYFKGGFSITEHCSPGLPPIPNTPDLDVNLIIQRPGIGSIEYAPMGMAERVSEKVDCTVQALVKNIFAPTELQVESIERCGSTAEGTSVGLPDEYDYLFKFTDKHENCELVDHCHGYRYLESERMVLGRGSKFFHDFFWTGLSRALMEIRNNEDVAIEDIPNVQDGGSASTEVMIKCSLPGTNRPFRVSVDMVPVIHFDNAWPEKGIQRTWLMDKETLKSRGYALVAKPPHKKSKMGKAMKEADRTKLYQLSFSHLETEHIASLDARIKNAFIAAKCIRNPEVCRIFMKESDGVLHEVGHYLTTYLLKTVFLHNVEDFLATEKTLLHMVYIIYNELEVCLAKEFLPNFWVDDVNVLEGLSIDAKKSLQVARLMKRLVGRWYDAEEAGVSEGATASSSEDAPSVGYHAYEFDDVA